MYTDTPMQFYFTIFLSNKQKIMKTLNYFRQFGPELITALINLIS